MCSSLRLTGLVSASGSVTATRAGNVTGRPGVNPADLSCRSCGHGSIGSHDVARGRFRRALDRRQATLALTAAVELPHVSLTDALELMLLLRDTDLLRFERAVLRWHGAVLP